MKQPGRPVIGSFLLACLLSACQAEGATLRGDRAEARPVPAGDADRGWALVQSYGCDACHSIPGVGGAESFVGPPLTAWADRQFIAGNLDNTAENLVAWIMDPQAIEPGTAMPNLGVPLQEARDIGAYLFTLDSSGD